MFSLKIFSTSLAIFRQNRHFRQIRQHFGIVQGCLIYPFERFRLDPWLNFFRIATSAKFANTLGPFCVAKYPLKRNVNNLGKILPCSPGLTKLFRNSQISPNLPKLAKKFRQICHFCHCLRFWTYLATWGERHRNGVECLNVLCQSYYYGICGRAMSTSCHHT